MSLLSNELQLPINAFPPFLASFYEQLKQHIHPLQIMPITMQNEKLWIQCNIPLAGHAAKLIVEYDKISNTLDFTTEIYADESQHPSELDQIVTFINNYF